MKKRFAAVCLTLSVVFGGLSPALGAEETAVEVTLNGYALEVGALARDGTTLAPVEEFLAALGGPVVTSYWDGAPLPGGMLYRWDEIGRTLSVQWYDKSFTLIPWEDGAELRDGVLWAPLRPLAEALGLTVEWTGKVELTYPKRRVEVDNLKDLFLAVAPDTEIVLKRGNYSFADLDPKELEEIDSPYFYVDYDLFDLAAGEWGLGTVYQVVIRDVRDLELSAGGCRVATPWAYADVWHFENCRRVTLEGGTAIHDVEPGYCIGNCAELDRCEDMLLDSVVLDGSGAYGLYADGCRNVLLKNANITHCTYGAVALNRCENVTVDAGHIYENTADFNLLSISDCANTRVSRCLIEDNSAGALGSYLGSREVVFEDCTFGENSFSQTSDFGWQESGGAVFVDCGVTAGTFQGFLEERKLSGLIAPGLTMTAEDEARVVGYFLGLPEPERSYVTLLLGLLAAGEPTAVDGYCDPESGVFLTACRYCLYDIDGDGAPEFILKTGSSEADFGYTVYAIQDGALAECGGFSGGHATLYADGQGGLLRYMGQMGVYELTEVTLDRTELAAKEIAAGQADFGKGEDYPDLSEYGYGADSQPLEFTALPALFLAPKG